MALPTVALPKGTVDFDGQSIPVRGLSRGEALHLATIGETGNAAEAEVQLLAHGLDTALAEVREWYNGVPSHVVQALVKKVMELSGMDGLGNA